MASIFGHTILGGTIAALLLPERRHARWWAVAAACAFLPDADAIGYKLGVAYESLWGHRGLTHSLLAAVAVASLLALLSRMLPSRSAPPSGRLWLLLFLATASHGVLDAATTGGLGVAFFSPFDLERYFFPLRPIKVSPIGIRAFFSSWGLRVLASEALWVALPCMLLLVLRAGLVKRASEARKA
ncbi:metal-dependent hydrolase [Hymenobacter saemangeumensis]|uniref:Metal-dependent hydrolase n=1 Tax=Hymenobacter saemangeumensis TaxID=1084522 RepID=A0ABP8I313_9BACT